MLVSVGQGADGHGSWRGGPPEADRWLAWRAGGTRAAAVVVGVGSGVTAVLAGSAAAEAGWPWSAMAGVGCLLAWGAVTLVPQGLLGWAAATERARRRLWAHQGGRPESACLPVGMACAGGRWSAAGDVLASLLGPLAFVVGAGFWLKGWPAASGGLAWAQAGGLTLAGLVQALAWVWTMEALRSARAPILAAFPERPGTWPGAAVGRLDAGADRGADRRAVGRVDSGLVEVMAAEAAHRALLETQSEWADAPAAEAACLPAACLPDRQGRQGLPVGMAGAAPEAAPMAGAVSMPADARQGEGRLETENAAAHEAVAASAGAGGLRQTMRRWTQEDGTDVIEGACRVCLPAGQLRVIEHVGFCPSFAGRPEVECQAADRPEAIPVEVQVTTVAPYGMRVEVQIEEPPDEDRYVELTYRAWYQPG